MKTKNLSALAAWLGLSLIQPRLATAHAQGLLTPPAGPPGPVMKSLDQIEARTPLVAGAPGILTASGRFTITQPGSYYLTGNLVCTNGGGHFILFATNNVTLDLNGFTLFGVSGILSNAIHGTGFGYRVFNGHIVGGTTQANGVFSPAGFYTGIELFSGNVEIGTDSLVSGVTVRGMRNRGISASLNSIVQNCAVDTVADIGVFCGSISDCNVINTRSDAIFAGRVLNCFGKCVGSGDGIGRYSWEYPTVQNSRGESVSGHGIFTVNALNCYGRSETGVGLYAYLANSCSAWSQSYGTAIEAQIGIACFADRGTNKITHKYNMP